MPAYDLSPLREQFPALALTEAGRPAVYFDGPGGTQVPRRVINAISRYLTTTNANHGGAFRTSRESDAISTEAHGAAADFLNAPSAREICFGANMTTLTFAFSRAIGRTLEPGDEIIVTRLDHEANRGPWLALAERGVIVHEIPFNPVECTLRMGELGARLNERTRLVAVGYASNAVGTVNPIAHLAEMVHAANPRARLWVDAVHYAPHGPIDVQSIGCDYLVCSAYKFFGPHSSLVWGRYELLEELRAYKVRPAGDRPPDKFETGTQSFEAQAGVAAAIDYLAEVGATYGAAQAALFPGFAGRRLLLKQAMATIQAYERSLFETFVSGLMSIPGLTFYGICDPGSFAERTPTAGFTLANHSPLEVADALATRGVYVWEGDFYASTVVEDLGLKDRGGLVRAGLAHYNTAEEVDYCLDCLKELAH